MEDITNAEYTYAKRFCKNFKIKNLGKYYDSFARGNTLLLENEFESF